MNSTREMFRHTVATLAYRASKILRDAPEDFAGYRPNESSRTPGELLAHLGDLIEWASSMAQGSAAWKTSVPLPWPEEVARFHGELKRFDDYLASDQPMGAPIERLFQGPIADALTHVGQLGMLRRLAGAPMRSENYYQAGIKAGQVGPEQEAPKLEFD